MDKHAVTRGLAASALPLASLRLLVSPLQLAYSYIWQVIQRRQVKQYHKVEEFVTMVTQAVPELMSFKQTAQLILGLRARIILELVKESTPDSRTIRALINKLKITDLHDSEVGSSQNNFMVLVQILLKCTTERKRFFQEVFPVRYGTKFDTALQALIAGLVYKLEQLLPVPDLSKLGAMIPTQPHVLEECGHFIPDHADLKVLLRHQKQKGFLTTSAISSTVGDCVLTSLSFLPNLADPGTPQDQLQVSEGAGSASPCSDPDDPEGISNEIDVMETETPLSPADMSPIAVCKIPNDTAVKLKEKGDGVKDGLSVHAPASSEVGAAQESSREICDVVQSAAPQNTKVDVAPLPPEVRTTPEKANPQQLAMGSIPFRIVQVAVRNISTSQNPASDGTGDRDAQQKLPTQRVTLHQWVSQIANNSLSLPTLPPICPPRLSGMVRARPSLKRESLVKSPVERFTCDVCDKRFTYQSKLIEHQRIHTGEKPFVCAACGKGFRTQAFLNTHLMIHSTARPYKCGNCGRCFHRMASLKKHMLTHSDRKPFYCGVCNKGFTQSTYFKRHMECHTSQTSFPCGECGKTFPTEFKLANHQRWHTRDRQHMCERCGKRFLVPSLLKRHMGYHIGERQYLCSQCGKTFVYLSDLKRHQKDHGPKTKLPCHICQKKFSSKYCLRIHMRIHTREKPYKCHICEKSFTQIGNLKVHVRLHNNERPYSCDQCGKSYKLTSHLNAHKRTHLFKKPWTCETCRKGFSLPGLLKKHEQLHLKEAAGYSGKTSHRSKMPSLKRRYEEDDNGGDVY